MFDYEEWRGACQHRAKNRTLSSWWDEECLRPRTRSDVSVTVTDFTENVMTRSIKWERHLTCEMKSSNSTVATYVDLHDEGSCSEGVDLETLENSHESPEIAYFPGHWACKMK